MSQLKVLPDILLYQMEREAQLKHIANLMVLLIQWVNGRRWHYGVLVPWITYASLETIPYDPPDYTIYRYTSPMMISSKVGQIQKALNVAGFITNGIDNIFGTHTLKAVKAFQQSRNLVVDGEVGKDTARELGIQL